MESFAFGPKIKIFSFFFTYHHSGEIRTETNGAIWLYSFLMVATITLEKLEQNPTVRSDPKPLERSVEVSDL